MVITSDYIYTNGQLYNVNELQHYGVPGMKWGVIRAKYKSASNERLRKRALKYDKKDAIATKKSEKIHAKEDLGFANRKAVKAAKYRKQASVLEKRSVKAESDFDQARLHRKAERKNYKAAKMERTANRISKTKGYSARALKYSIKSDVAAAKAAKARKKIANNEYYIQRMKKKVSTISKEDLQGAYKFVEELKNI